MQVMLRSLKVHLRRRRVERRSLQSKQGAAPHTATWTDESALFPEVVNLDTYRLLYDDLSHLDDHDLLEHWCSFGAREGRQGNSLASREQFVELVSHVAPVSRTLEISPFAYPLLPGAHTCDVLNYDDLVNRAAAIGADPSRVPPVDFLVDDDSGLDSIESTFAAVLSSHVLEHVPDLIGHLHQVTRRLDVGGYYFVLVPDCRYCFDHFIPPSTVAEAIVAHHEMRSRHPIRSVIEHRALTTHNDPVRHWAGDHGLFGSNFVERMRNAIDEYQAANGRYIDVHGWYFTPESFEAVIRLLCQAHDVCLSPVRVYPTRRNCNEFWAILRRENNPA
jgi:hypothetical protein